MTERDKVTVDEVIGLIHTDKPTDSVEEVRKLRGRENRTKKRFTYFKSKIGFGKQGIDDNLKGYTFDFTLDNVLDCMNDLSEENEQLKKDCTVLIYHNQEYRKENEQLKSYNGEMEDYLARLEEKNEQLKADKQALIDFIKKEFPKSHKHILEGFE